MILYTKLVKQPVKFKQFTGLKIEEFQKLYKKIEKGYDELETKRLSSKKRKRHWSGILALEKARL